MGFVLLYIGIGMICLSILLTMLRTVLSID